MGMFHRKNEGMYSNICVWKWVHVCLETDGKLPFAGTDTRISFVSG